MIHQHFMLVPQLTVTENIILGQSSLQLDLKAKANKIAQMAKAYGLDVPTQARVADLPVGIQQRVEILKVLYRQARILILDEPTAVLTPDEITAFLQILRALAERNHTIIFISHKLNEIMAVCDQVTVLRRGSVVASLSRSDSSPAALARLMVDREVQINQRPLPQAAGAPVLKIQQLWVNSQTAVIRDLSLTLRAGEILGIAGVDGNGQRPLADAIAQLVPIQQGSIQLSNAVTQIAYIPEDRQQQGLVLSFSIARNLILKAFAKLPFCRRFLLQEPAIAANADRAIQEFDIRANSPQLKVSQLSGGNQQKVILARELAGAPALIIAMQPTRGLDIGATEAVQQSLLQQRSRGAAILYISTELEEIMALSDRIAVIYRGHIVDILEAKTATLEKIGQLMTSGTDAAAHASTDR